MKATQVTFKMARYIRREPGRPNNPRLEFSPRDRVLIGEDVASVTIELEIGEDTAKAFDKAKAACRAAHGLDVTPEEVDRAQDVLAKAAAAGVRGTR